MEFRNDIPTVDECLEAGCTSRSFSVVIRTPGGKDLAGTMHITSHQIDGGIASLNPNGWPDVMAEGGRFTDWSWRFTS